MKIRAGFVSNSSSSSFTIRKDCLNTLQVAAIKQHVLMGEQLGLSSADDSNEWSISEDDGHIKGFAIMDNFDMSEYLSVIGVNPEDVRWNSF